MSIGSSRPMTDEERRTNAARQLDRAADYLHDALRLLDGLEWSARIEAIVEEVEGITPRVRAYNRY